MGGVCHIQEFVLGKRLSLKLCDIFFEDILKKESLLHQQNGAKGSTRLERLSFWYANAQKEVIIHTHNNFDGFPYKCFVATKDC